MAFVVLPKAFGISVSYPARHINLAANEDQSTTMFAVSNNI